MKAKKQSMKRKALILTIISITGMSLMLSGCYRIDNRMRGNGNMIERSVTINEPITRVDLSRVSATLVITNQPNDQITYTIDENLDSYLEIKVSNGTLDIDSSNHRYLGRDHRITFHVGIEMLEELNISGDWIVRGNGLLSSDQFRSDIDGAAEVDLELDAEEITVSIDGAADLTLSGQTNDLSIAINGAADINTRDLAASDAIIDFNGASTIDVYAENTLDISGSGAGTIQYWGDPALTNSIQGLTSVKHVDS